MAVTSMCCDEMVPGFPPAYFYCHTGGEPGNGASVLILSFQSIWHWFCSISDYFGFSSISTSTNLVSLEYYVKPYAHISPLSNCGTPFMVRTTHLEAVDESNEATDEAIEEYGQDWQHQVVLWFAVNVEILCWTQLHNLHGREITLQSAAHTN